jgi:hypothetical protein
VTHLADLNKHINGKIRRRLPGERAMRSSLLLHTVLTHSKIIGPTTCTGSVENLLHSLLGFNQASHAACGVLIIIFGGRRFASRWPYVRFCILWRRLSLVPRDRSNVLLHKRRVLHLESQDLAYVAQHLVKIPGTSRAESILARDGARKQPVVNTRFKQRSNVKSRTPSGAELEQNIAGAKCRL